MTPVPGLILILMPLKLLQAEQSTMINRIANAKSIFLNGENNLTSVHREIAKGGYTHVFTSPEIALSKKFKKNVLDQSSFTDRLYLLAIDEIHLVDQWGQSFRPLYAEIEKVRKRIPCHVPLLGVSATLTKATRSRILDKAGFLPNYKLTQTSLDRPEIMQLYRFMEHSKASCLDLQFILKTAAKANDIQKTVIFVNSINDIRPMINIFVEWMQKLGYQDSCTDWIRPYYSTISEWDKEITAKAFMILGDQNEECTIVVATDAYGMGINNPDIRLVVQWDLPITIDAMIQRLGRAGRDCKQSIFMLITPKWTNIKDPKELEQRQNKNAAPQLSNDNRPKAHPLSHFVDANSISDTESVAESEAESDDGDVDETDLLSTLLATESEAQKKQRSAKKRTSKNDAAKRASLPNDIFDYIHVAPCRRLYSLALYDDMTYASLTEHSGKALPDLCCNVSGCRSVEPDYLKQGLHFDTEPAKHNEYEREWIAYRSQALKQWREKAFTQLWSKEGIDEPRPNSLIMSNTCLVALAKNADSLHDEQKLVQFLKPWYGVDQHRVEILACLKIYPAEKPPDNLESTATLVPRSDRKEALKAARASKKVKYMDDPVVAAVLYTLYS